MSWQVLTAEEAFDEFGFDEDAKLVLYQSYPFGSVAIWPMPDGRFTVGECESYLDHLTYREGTLTFEQVAERYDVTSNVLEALAASGCAHEKEE